MKPKNLLTIILIFNIIAIILIITKKLETTIIKCILLTLPIIIPTLLKKLKISINNTIEKMYLILIFLSGTLGRIYRLYYITNWYDTLVHGISGILTFILAQIIIKHYKLNKNILFNIIFGITLTMSLGTLWELTEFDIDQIFKTNMQSVETGLLDTMKDLSIATITSIITAIIYLKSEMQYKKINKNPQVPKPAIPKS